MGMAARRKEPQPEFGSERMSSISSKSRIDLCPGASRRWASPEFLEPLLPAGFVVIAVHFADTIEVRSEPSGQRLAKLGFAGPRWPYTKMFTPGVPVDSAPLTNFSMWSRSSATWSKSAHSSSPGVAASSSRLHTSRSLLIGAEASRPRRSTLVISPSSSTDTSPDRTSGASAAKRVWNESAGTPRTQGRRLLVTLKNLRMLWRRPVSKQSQSGPR